MRGVVGGAGPTRLLGNPAINSSAALTRAVAAPTNRRLSCHWRRELP